MLWFKALHLIFMVTWFAGIFYLPRLYVYHAMSDDTISIERFKVMERKLFWGIMTPGGILTIVFGLFTLSSVGMNAYQGSGWLHAKLFLVFVLVLYHVHCGILLKAFKQDRNIHSHVWYRFYNEVPVFILIAIIILAVVRPF